MDDKIIRNMRHMAWERAKGELRSMLHTFWGGNDKYKELKGEINRFIEEVESNGLQE